MGHSSKSRDGDTLRPFLAQFWAEAFRGDLALEPELRQVVGGIRYSVTAAEEQLVSGLQGVVRPQRPRSPPNPIGGYWLLWLLVAIGSNWCQLAAVGGGLFKK
jgi:hypothetical protein